MIGYTKNNNEFYRGEYIEHYIKSAVSRSGGNIKHYEIFSNLIKGSIYNKTLNTNHHDCRAGYSLLFIYPIRIRILLSLVFYKAEINSLTEYGEYDIQDNIVDPLQNLLLIDSLNKVSVSRTIINNLRTLGRDFELYSLYLRDLTSSLYIKENFDFRNLSLEEQIQKVFLLFNNSYPINKDFINISSSNNRVTAASYLCKHLNYKPVSINLLNQAIEKWTQDNLNT